MLEERMQILNTSVANKNGRISPHRAYEESLILISLRKLLKLKKRGNKE